MIRDRVWLITIEFNDNRKVLDDLLHQTYIEEDFSKGKVHMTALPGGLTKSKVDTFTQLLKMKLENHANSKTGLDRSALEAVGKAIWLELNPQETDRSNQQGAALATAMLEGVAPEPTFAVDKLQNWLHDITKMIGGPDVDAPKGDLVVASRRDRFTLTASVDDYDRSALWIHCCSLMDYMILSCGRKIAHLSTEELRLLQLTHFIKQQDEKSDSTEDDDDDTHDQRDSVGTVEYWKRDSDSTYSQSSFVDRFRMSWSNFQKESASGMSAPNTPRSHFSVGSIALGGQKTARSNVSGDGHKTARSGSWFMGDLLFEA